MATFVLLQIPVPREDRARIEALATAQGTSVAAVAQDLLHRALEDHLAATGVDEEDF